MTEILTVMQVTALILGYLAIAVGAAWYLTVAMVFILDRLLKLVIDVSSWLIDRWEQRYDAN